MVLKVFRTPSEQFEFLIRILRFCAAVCGIDLLRENYHMNWITYTLFAGVVSYYSLIFWTIYITYKEDWTIILTCSVTFATALQGVSKLIAFISNKDVIMDLYKLLSGIYRDYEKMGNKYWKALQRSAEKTKRGLISLLIFYIAGYMGVVISPHIFLLLNGKRVLVLEFRFPGLDVNTDFGYYTTVAFQTGLIIGVGFGMYCGDLVALIYVQQSFMFSYIFAAKIEYLNDMVENPDNNKNPRVTRALKEIAEWFQIYSNYTTKCNNLFYYVITVQIVTSFCSTVISIYLIIAGGWAGAYAYVINTFCCLYLYCILGTQSEIANEQFETDIYDLHWYNLTVSQQKIVLQILVMTQTPKIIDIAGVMPLSVSTALSLTKTIYSMAMFMIQFFME